MIGLVQLLTAVAVASLTVFVPQAAAAETCRLLYGKNDWFDRASAIVDRRSLARAFSRQRYRSPDGALLIAARIVRGVDQPAAVYYSLGNTGFDQRFWPASTVKLVTAVGALMTLGARGLDGSTRLRFADGFGKFDGPLWRLYRPALVWSSNRAYDRLLLVAGIDALNQHISSRFGLPTMVIQTPYAGADTSRSPAIRYLTSKGWGTIAARRTTGSYGCSAGNCTTLFELQEVLRRVVLHEQLPAGQRFPIQLRDVRRIRRALLAAKSKIANGARRALGHPVRIYNKAGRYPGLNHLDNALVVDRRSGARYLVALSVRYGGRYRTDRATARQLDEIGRRTLTALRSLRGGAPLQHDAGTGLDVSVAWVPVTRTCRLRVKAGAEQQLRAWLDDKQQRLVLREQYFESDLPPRTTGKHLLVLQSSSRGRLTAYRSVWIEVGR